MPCIAPFSFDIFLFELLNPLLAGGEVEIFGLRPALDVERLTASLETATHFHAVPALMRQVVDTARRRPGRFPFPRLRELFVGGDAVPAELLAGMAEAFPEARTFVLYGPTEGAILASFHAVRDSRPLLGRPLRNVELRVVEAADQEVGQAVAPIGVAGELWIAGGGVTRGYLRQPELTAEKFVERGGRRWYRTGDLARWLADGNLEFLGRIDQQVKVRGFRIELGEIEARLAAHPAVREAVVLAPGAGADKRLVAYVIGEAGERETLHAHLAAALPDYMVPSGWVFLDVFPLTSNGKVDRKALARIEPEPASTAAYVAPRTPAAELLAGIWADLLGLDRVGARDDFFALGGHSLVATRLVSRVRDAFGVELPLRAVFEASVLADLALRIEAAGGGAEAPPIERLRRQAGERLPLSFAQERLWFLDRLGAAAEQYSVPAALRAAGAPDVAALQAAVGEIVRRHETLRSTFHQDQGEPWLRIEPAAEIPVPVVDLSALPAAAREPEAERRLRAEASRPFDLSTGPLLRVLLLRLAAEEWAIYLNLHHIVSDGWSVGVFVRELGELYAAAREGRPAGLPELPVQYADYAAWQRSVLSGAVLEAQLAYWREALAGAATVLELPTDRPRPPVQTLRGANRLAEIPSGLAEALRALSRREGATLFMTLLAGFQALLGRYSGQRDVLVGSPIANRQRSEVEGLIGLFVNAVTLRGRMEGEPSFRGFLERVRAAALGAYAHQDLPFERLVQEMEIERSLARNPLYQAVFALQNAPSGALRLPGLTLESLDLDTGTAKLDLLLSFSEGDSPALPGGWEYSTDLFDAATIDRLSGHLNVLLEAAAADPDRALWELPLLTGRERVQLLLDWNDTDLPGEDLRLHERFELLARQNPGAARRELRGPAPDLWRSGRVGRVAGCRVAGAGRRTGGAGRDLCR